MRHALLPLLRCPSCHAHLDLRVLVGGDPVEAAVLSCPGGHWYPVRDGIPRLLPPPYRRGDPDFVRRYGLDLPLPPGTTAADDSQLQVQESFTAKWGRMPQFGFDRPDVREFYDEWFRRKLGLPDPEAFARFLRGKRFVLDAGTGLGAKVETVCRLNPSALVVGVDIADSVEDAARNTRDHPGAQIVQADLRDLPLPPDTFDLIVSDGVLHHTPDAHVSFRALLPFLRPGGHIGIHVYRKMGPLREFCDDFLRQHTTRMSPEACWQFAETMTRLGQALTEAKAEVVIPETVPFLEIPAGRYDVQWLFYYHVLKCFWNPTFCFEENVLVNFDWYHPADASRHTEAEVVGWFREAGLVEVRAHRANENGVSVVGRRPGGGGGE